MHTNSDKKFLASFKLSKIQVALFLAFTLSFQGCLGGEIICEDLPKNKCAFAIASSGKRCLIENYASNKDGKMTTEYQTCRTSEVVVDGISNWIESDECIRVCGVDRNSVGISYDSLLDSKFVSKLCSPSCCLKCPNIFDLYFNLAVEKGVFLPDLCEVQQTNPHRAMIQVANALRAPDSNYFVALATAASPGHAPGPDHASGPNAA
ncbi:PAR1 [Macleaya cordata]|uniref:PAR1 n=1 Tax=Macleaya cordata TaxID=56857 RepID=A0A200R4W6_MACCD|nr:PAR1 [Macleaya cordata]